MGGLQVVVECEAGLQLTVRQAGQAGGVITVLDLGEGFQMPRYLFAAKIGREQSLNQRAVVSVNQ